MILKGMYFMITKENKYYFIFLTAFLLTISDSTIFISVGINKAISLLACTSLFVQVLTYYLNDRKGKNKESIKKGIAICLIGIFLACIGSLLQYESFSILLRIAFPAVILISSITISDNYENDYLAIRSFSYGIFVGIAMIFIVSLLGEAPVMEKTAEGLLKNGLNGGFQYKNYFAATALSGFMGLFICLLKDRKVTADIFLMIIETLMILLSGSRGTVLMLLIFVFMILGTKYIVNFIARFKQHVCHKRERIIILISVSILLSIVAILIVSQSSTYSYRIRGVKNYFEFYGNDCFHLLFGNSSLVFKADSSYYVAIIRSTISGFDGSYEMGFINVIIKNGLLGLAGYILCYVYLIKKVLHKKSSYVCISIFILLMISSLVEAYVCSVHTIFGLQCYLLINGIANIDDNTKQYSIGS